MTNRLLSSSSQRFPRHKIYKSFPFFTLLISSLLVIHSPRTKIWFNIIRNSLLFLYSTLRRRFFKIDLFWRTLNIKWFVFCVQFRWWLRYSCMWMLNVLLWFDLQCFAMFSSMFFRLAQLFNVYSFTNFGNISTQLRAKMVLLPVLIAFGRTSLARRSWREEFYNTKLNLELFVDWWLS